MAEETTVTEDDIQDVSLLDTPAPTETAASTEADKGKEDAASTDKTEEDKAGDANDTKAKENQADDKSTEESQQQEQSPEQQKAERDRIARDAYLQRQNARKQVEQKIDEHYGPKTAEDLVEDGMKPEQAEIEAMKQRMAFSEQRAKIAELNATMQAEAVNAINDFSMFNEKSSDYDKEFTEQVQQAYQVAARVQVDENGIITNAEVPLYDFYKQMAGIYSRGASRGSQNSTQDALNMLSRTEDTLGGSSSTNKGSESLEDMEARLGDASII